MAKNLLKRQPYTPKVLTDNPANHLMVTAENRH